MKKQYRIADVVISVSSIHENVHRLCRDYAWTDGEPEIEVVIHQEDIEYERERADRPCTDSYLETLAVYRRIAEKMPAFDTFLFHGSCVAVDGAGYLFTAKSGTGKSTHTRLWRELLGEKAVMINDDKPLIRMTENGAAIYGTPWDGKHRLSTNTCVPLKAVCVLERAEENRIRRISVSEAYPVLLQQTYRPSDGLAMAKTLDLTDRLAASVSLWRLGCNMDLSAAELAYEAMKGDR